MSGRLVSLGAPIVLLGAFAGAIIAACYNLPTPDCGFLCGQDSACPDSYTCASDHYCHRNGTPATLVCATPDASMPDTPGTPGDAGAKDAAIDARPDAAIDARPDAAIDARPDAPPDAAIDAPPDAAIDAPPDAAIDAS